MDDDLFVAAKDGNIQSVKQAIENGANVNYKNSEGLSAIMAAGFFGHVDVVKYLIIRGADINAKNNSGGTTLMTATMNNHVEVVRVLIENSVDVNSKSSNGGNALVAAAQNGNDKIVELLLVAGADYSVAVKGYTPLKLAEANGYPKVVALIKAAQNGTLKAKPSQLTVPATSNAETRLRGPQVTSNRLWKCPKCGTVLEKKGLGKVWNIGDPISRVAGNATCGGCLSRYDQADVYGGMYDVKENAKQDDLSNFNGTVSMVVYQLMSTNSPNNAKAICEDLLSKKYPQATIGEFYCIGRNDNTISSDEGLVLYKEYVDKGTINALGTQFDTYQGVDITGKNVVVLFFRK